VIEASVVSSSKIYMNRLIVVSSSWYLQLLELFEILDLTGIRNSDHEI
jgi:hypothetical protein